MATENDHDIQADDSLAIQPAGPSVQLSEVTIDIDNMYQTISNTLSALTNTTVDGESSDDITPDLQAHSNKQYLPDTELEILQQGAVPMTDADIKAHTARQELLKSVQHRKAQLKIPSMTIAETTGPRIRVAYRLLRYMTHVRGIGGVGEPLIFSMASSNPQVNLFELPIPFDPTAGWYTCMAAVRNILSQVTEAGYTYSYLLVGSPYETSGMSIMPPPLHDGYYPDVKEAWQYRKERYTPEGYRADTDAPLAAYLNICELLVRHLGIAETDIGEQAAVAALLNPRIARMAWPCRDEIETYEEYVLMPYIGRLITDHSQLTAIEELKKEMQLTHSEAFDMSEMYKTYAEQAYTFEAARERAIMLNKLHDLADECGEAGMVTTKLNSFKSVLQVLGLTRHEEEANVDRRAGLASALEAEITGEKQESQKQLPEGNDQN